MKSIIRIVLKTFFSSVLVIAIVASFVTAYFLGLLHGYGVANDQLKGEYVPIIRNLTERLQQEMYNTPVVTLTPSPKPTSVPARAVRPEADWGGPELWQAVNDRRQELGVNSLGQRDELCTIASIRLNELLELGKLDSHEGFSNMRERRPDLAWIFDKYSTVAEFLAMGGQSAEETVSLWENTLGHSKLLKGGEYVWGCIYAQNTFAVAITAF